MIVINRLGALLLLVGLVGMMVRADGPSASASLSLSRAGANAVQLSWPAPAGAARFQVLRSETLGWSGTAYLTEAVTMPSDATLPKPTTVKVTTTRGLRPGDQVHFDRGREDNYVKQVVDGGTLELQNPLLRSYRTNAPMNLSAAWLKDYSQYGLIGETAGTTWTDGSVEPGKDYFYVVVQTTDEGQVTHLGPAQCQLEGETGLLFDAALACYGGYAWKVTQQYGDTPGLIDGDPDSTEINIEVNNPLLTRTNRYTRLGFHRLYFNGRVPLRKVEISQDISSTLNRMQASRVRIGFDDQTSQEFLLLEGNRVTRRTEGKFEVFTLPVDRASSYINIFVEAVVKQNNYYIVWNRVSAYTDAAPGARVSSAQDLAQTEVVVDIDTTTGQLPTVFGTDEVYDNTDGREEGWMLRAWPYTTSMFNLYRIQTGDYWPRAYGENEVQIGELAAPLKVGETTFVLTNVKPGLGTTYFGARLLIGLELVRLRTLYGTNGTLYERGYENTVAMDHAVGTPVYAFKNAGQILRLQEVLPEFKVEKLEDAYLSGLRPISAEVDPKNPNFVDVNDPIRTGELSLRVKAGEYRTGDVLRIGREMFLVKGVESVDASTMALTVQRGFDGTVDPFIQHNNPVRDIYRILDYEPYYEGFKNDPANPANYYWTNWKTTMDKVIRQAKALPWIIAYAPIYATEGRTRVAALETVENPAGVANNVLVDEYNAAHDDQDWWYELYGGNTEPNATICRGNVYQFGHAYVHVLTGRAAGKVFYVRSHSTDRLRVVRSKEDSYWTNENPVDVDLAAEGVSPGDVVKIRHWGKSYANVTRKFWQYNADLYHQIVKYIRDQYAADLAGRPIYVEYYIEPNLPSYGTWNKRSYIDSYKLLAETVRNGGPHFSSGFERSQVWLGAGAIAGGLNPQVPIPGTVGDYDLALSLIESCSVLDFVSHHRYYMGSRVQKRDNSWEYYMLRGYAASLGKDVRIIDSEDSVATAGGTGKEEARHWANFGVPYWHANFINSFAGEFGELGRLDFIIHFRHFQRGGANSMGMASCDSNLNPLLDLVYWPIKLYQQHTSIDSRSPDQLLKVLKSGDQFGWVQTMATYQTVSGDRKIHLVNKKESPVKVKLVLVGSAPSRVEMESVIGAGPYQTIEDGYHPLEYSGRDGLGVTRRVVLGDLDAITLEPCSANVITLTGGSPAAPRNLRMLNE